MMTRGIKVTLAVKVVLMMVMSLMVFGFAACTETNAASDPSQPAAQVLKFGSWQPQANNFAYEPIFLAFSRAVEANSKGRLKIELYMNGSLAPSQDSGKATSSGVQDIGEVTDTYEPEKYRMSQALSLPPIWGGMYESLHKLRPLMDDAKYGFKEDVDKQNMVRIGFYIGPPYQLLTMTKRVNKVDDLKGLKIRANSQQTAKFESLLGAIPTTVTGPNTADALQKGVLDGTVGRPANTFYLQGLYQLGKPGYLVDWKGPAFWQSYCINKDVYNKLTPDLQKVIMDAGWTYLSSTFAALFDANDVLFTSYMVKSGVVPITWAPAEVAKMRQKTGSMWSDWVKATDAAGRPGTAVVDFIRSQYPQK